MDENGKIRVDPNTPEGARLINAAVKLLESAKRKDADANHAPIEQADRPRAVASASVPGRRPLLPAAEVATILGVSKQHVYGMMDRGQLPYVRVPGKSEHASLRRVDPQDLDRWIDAHKTKPQTKEE